MWCPGMARGLPSLSYLPMRGPSTMIAGQRGDAAHGVDHAGAREVDVAEAEVPRVAQLGEPAAAPGPRTEDRVQRPAQKRPQSTKFFHFQRSAMAPVGIVAVASMKATM